MTNLDNTTAWVGYMLFIFLLDKIGMTLVYFNVLFVIWSLFDELEQKRRQQNRERRTQNERKSN